MSRTKNSIKNSFISVIFQAISLLLNFVVRMFFIKYLTTTDLGINGLFTNILNVLSIAELGIGEAINFAMYKPLANNEIEKIKKIMKFYKKVYLIIGAIITIAALSLMPFLSLFMNDIEYTLRIAIIYFLFIANTTVSYLFSYKRNLLIADQKMYITSICKYIFYTIFKIFQIVYLVLCKDYIGYLIIQVIETIFEYASIAIVADIKYPYLREKVEGKIDEENKKEITKNTKAMMMHKIGDVIVNSTDNILISKIVGIIAVGLYSNYYMITSSLTMVYNQIYSSITSSVGNLCVNADSNKKYDVFKKIDFLTFILYCCSSVILFNALNDFIVIWLGEDYLFNISIVAIICVNFYLAGMRKSVQTFREATGLFYKDRWKSIVEAIVNIIVSVLLGIKFGVLGIFIGTTITYLTTCCFIESYILYKYCFNEKFHHYIIDFLKRIIILVVSCTISYYFYNLIDCILIIKFVIGFCLSSFISMAIIVIFYFRDDSFKWSICFSKNIFAKLFKRKKQKKE